MDFLTRLLFTVLVFFPSGCSYKWVANPVIDRFYENCKPSISGDPQMVFVPGYKNTAIVVEDCRYFRREKISIALQTFQLEWESMFGKSEDFSKNLSELVIVFSFESRKSMGYTINGDLVQNANLLGATMSKNSIWVYVNPYTDRVCDTSLVHELVHASIWAINKSHGDPDHVGNNFLGWTDSHNILIHRVNAHLCKLGI